MSIDGTLQLSANNQLTANPTVYVASDGTLETGGRSETLGGLTMSGGLVDSGSGTLTLAGSLQYQASNYTATINGNLSLGGSTRTINVISGSAFDLMINAAVSGSPGAGIVKTANTGMLTLGGANTYTGPTVVNGGYLQIGVGGSGESLASPSISLNNSSSLYLSQADTFVYSGSISGNGSVEQFGPGTAVLAGANAYTGSTTVSGGTLEIAAPAALPSASAIVISGGGRLVLGSGAGIGALLTASPPSAVRRRSRCWRSATPAAWAACWRWPAPRGPGDPRRRDGGVRNRRRGRGVRARAGDVGLAACRRRPRTSLFRWAAPRRLMHG